MRENLDRWIKNARDEVPDSGEYRRLNRVMLKERMLTARPGSHGPHRLLVVFVILVFLLLFSGHISQLGGDGFDMTSSIMETTSGAAGTVHENVFRGGSVAAGEGSIVEVIGLSYGGKTLWLKFVKRIINGKDNIAGETTDNPTSEIPDNHTQFLKTCFSDLKARTNSDPPHEKKRMAVDGVMLDFRIWTYEYPGFGKVSRYIGSPVKKS